ncbi:MAG: hypothetical protein L0216_00020 [Planctomycetales bacterium]|nr:hypothetical protein [Planctomycetales bacterium]
MAEAEMMGLRVWWIRVRTVPGGIESGIEGRALDCGGPAGCEGDYLDHPVPGTSL